MRTLLLLALATSLCAQVTRPEGYHIVHMPPGESHATPVATSASTTGARRIRRPASHSKGASGNSGYRAPSMSAQLTSKNKKH